MTQVATQDMQETTQETTDNTFVSSNDITYGIGSELPMGGDLQDALEELDYLTEERETLNKRLIEVALTGAMDQSEVSAMCVRLEALSGQIRAATSTALLRVVEQEGAILPVTFHTKPNRVVVRKPEPEEPMEVQLQHIHQITNYNNTIDFAARVFDKLGVNRQAINVKASSIGPVLTASRSNFATLTDTAPVIDASEAGVRSDVLIGAVLGSAEESVSGTYSSAPNVIIGVNDDSVAAMVIPLFKQLQPEVAVAVLTQGIGHLKRAVFALVAVEGREDAEQQRLMFSLSSFNMQSENANNIALKMPIDIEARTMGTMDLVEVPEKA